MPPGDTGWTPGPAERAEAAELGWPAEVPGAESALGAEPDAPVVRCGLLDPLQPPISAVLTATAASTAPAVLSLLAGAVKTG